MNKIIKRTLDGAFMLILSALGVAIFYGITSFIYNIFGLIPFCIFMFIVLSYVIGIGCEGYE